MNDRTPGMPDPGAASPRIGPGVKFVVVGLGGFALQLGVVAGLTRTTGWTAEAATALAVELAVLHNFLWHEHWSWRERSLTVAGRLPRFLRYQGSGVVNLAGNVLVTAAASSTHVLGPELANVLAVCVMAAINFRLADRWIFVSSR